MFARVYAFFLIAFFAVLAVATPTPQTNQQCNTGQLQCCQNVQTTSQNPLIGLLASLLGVVLGGVNVPVGVTCSPITIIGVSGTSCTAQPVCCTNNSFNGLIAIGCTPINISL